MKTVWGKINFVFLIFPSSVIIKKAHKEMKIRKATRVIQKIVLLFNVKIVKIKPTRKYPKKANLMDLVLLKFANGFSQSIFDI